MSNQQKVIKLPPNSSDKFSPSNESSSVPPDNRQEEICENLRKIFNVSAINSNSRPLALHPVRLGNRKLSLNEKPVRHYSISDPKNGERKIFMLGVTGLCQAENYGNYGGLNPRDNSAIGPESEGSSQFSISFRDVGPKDIEFLESVKRPETKEAIIQNSCMSFSEIRKMIERIKKELWENPDFFPVAKATATSNYQKEYESDWDKIKNSDPETLENAKKELKERYFMKKFASPIKSYNPSKKDEQGKKVVDENVTCYQLTCKFSAFGFLEKDTKETQELREEAARRIEENPSLADNVSFYAPNNPDKISAKSPMIILRDGIIVKDKNKKPQERFLIFTPLFVTDGTGKEIPCPISGSITQEKIAPKKANRNKIDIIEEVAFGKGKWLGPGSVVGATISFKPYDGEKFGIRAVVHNERPDNPIKVYWVNRLQNEAYAEEEFHGDDDDDYNNTATTKNGDQPVVSETVHPPGPNEQNGAQNPPQSLSQNAEPEQDVKGSNQQEKKRKAHADEPKNKKNK